MKTETKIFYLIRVLILWLTICMSMWIGYGKAKNEYLNLAVKHNAGMFEDTKDGKRTFLWNDEINSIEERKHK